AQPTGMAYGIHQLVQHYGRLFFTGCFSGLIPDGVNATIHTVILDCIVDLLGWVTVIKVDRFGTEFFCQIQTVLDVINHKDSACALQLCRVGSHQSNRSGTINGYGFADLDAGEFGGVIAGWENVCEHRKVFFVFVPFGQLYTVVVCDWHAQFFCLTTRIRSHANVPVGTTCGAWFVDGQTECRFTGAAVVTETTGNVEGHDHPVALLDGGDTGADFFDNAHVFVTEGDAGF